MNPKRLILLLLGILLVIGLATAILRLSSGEDNWLCVNGIWVRHGNPAGAKPASGCETPGETIKVKVFFMNNNLDPQITCTKVFPIERSIAKTQAVGRAALEELFLGPTPAEALLGYTTSLGPAVRLNSLTIASGTAYADFSAELDKDIGGSCRVSAIAAQISETLKQFPSVTEVIISRNGDSDTVLQP